MRSFLLLSVFVFLGYLSESKSFCRDSLNLDSAAIVRRRIELYGKQDNFEARQWLYEKCQQSGDPCLEEKADMDIAFREYMEALNPDDVLRRDLMKIKNGLKVVLVDHEFFDNFFHSIEVDGNIPDSIFIPDLDLKIEMDLEEHSRFNYLKFKAEITDVKTMSRIKLRRLVGSDENSIYVGERKKRVTIKQETQENSTLFTNQQIVPFGHEVNLNYKINLEQVRSVYDSFKSYYLENKNRMRYKKIRDKDFQVIAFFEISIIEIGYDNMDPELLRKFQDILPIKIYVAVSNRSIEEWGDKDYCIGEYCDNLKISDE